MRFKYQRIRKLFGWQYSGWFIAILFAVGLAKWSGHKFTSAYIFVLLAFLIAILFWEFSDSIDKKRNAWINSKGKADAKKKSEKDQERAATAKRIFLTWRILGDAAILVFLLVFVIWIRMDQIEYELDQLYGNLYPGDFLTPSWPCSPEGDEVALYIGTDAVKTGVFPLTIVSVGQKPMMVLDRNKDGSLVLVTDIRDKDDRLIVRLAGDGFIVNPTNYFRMIRKDRSSLMIFDERGDEVLNARYLNKKNFRLTAKIYSSGSLVDLRAGKVSAGNFSISGICMALPPNIGRVNFSFIGIP